MTYNLTGVASNTTGMLGFIQGVNDNLMFGWLGVVLLLGIVSVMFLSFYFSTKDVGKSVVGTAFIAFMLGVLMRAMGLIPDLAIFIILIGCGVAVAFLWRSN